MGDLKDHGKLDLKLFDPDPSADLSELEKDEAVTEEGFVLSKRRALRALAIGVAIGLVAAALIQIGAVTDFVSDTSFGKKFAPAAAAAVVAFLAGLFSQWIHISEKTVTFQSLSDPDRFQGKFEDMLAAIKAERLVIAIDNVDRASPEKAVEMLSTIKTYLEPASCSRRTNAIYRFKKMCRIKKVVFLVAVDDEALRRHLLARESATRLGLPRTRQCDTSTSTWRSSSASEFLFVESLRTTCENMLANTLGL